MFEHVSNGLEIQNSSVESAQLQPLIQQLGRKDLSLTSDTLTEKIKETSHSLPTIQFEGISQSFNTDYSLYYEGKLDSISPEKLAAGLAGNRLAAGRTSTNQIAELVSASSGVGDRATIAQRVLLETTECISREGIRLEIHGAGEIRPNRQLRIYLTDLQGHRISSEMIVNGRGTK